MAKPKRPRQATTPSVAGIPDQLVDGEHRHFERKTDPPARLTFR